MKLKYIIIGIILALVIMTLFIVLTVNPFNSKDNDKLGKINIVTSNDDLTYEQIERIKGDVANININEISDLYCSIVDENNVFVSHNFLSNIGLLTYRDKIYEYLLNNNYTGTLSLELIDNTVYSLDEYRYFSFKIIETGEVIDCIFNELTLQYNFYIQ